MASAVKSDEIPEPLAGKFKESFAYLTIKDRLPVILTKVIDSVYRERHAIVKAYDLESTEKVKKIISRLSELRNEMVTNKYIIPLKSMGPDVLLWNNYLQCQHKLYGFEPTWFDSPWLYIECYLYRRIKEAFELSDILNNYDPFKQQKDSSFISSMSAAVLLSKSLDEHIAEAASNPNIMFSLFSKFVEISLWGNKCDLSLSGGSESFQSDNPLSQVENLRKNILVNDINTLWKIFTCANEKSPYSVNLDIILDNAGFELFTDLCLLEFLHATKLINKVRFFVKMMPWYVSDTLKSDIDWLINLLMSSNEQIFMKFGKIWFEKFKSGIWSIHEEIFWTLPHDYSEMKVTDPVLFSKLSESDIAIFKGDLNYRKLTSDRKWDPTTPFVTTLRGFLPTSICSLRTIKNDVVTNLRPGLKEELDNLSSNWLFTGQYAVIQCVPKN